MKGIIRAVVDAVARRRRSRVLRVVDQAPLFGGCTVHVIEAGGRRLVFASSAGAICLLTELDHGREQDRLEGSR